MITVYLVDDQLQKLETDTCGIFQLYFYFNLFVPFENSSVLGDSKLSKRTVEKLLNEIFLIGIETKKKWKDSLKKKILEE